MRIDLIPTGKNPPEDLNVIIEVPTGGEPVKYEFDKASGALFVDRILQTPMRYPANYGFVPAKRDRLLDRRVSCPRHTGAARAPDLPLEQ
jgi:inorganic pyrophosphatase